jgi:hypothetical protein
VVSIAAFQNYDLEEYNILKITGFLAAKLIFSGHVQ